MHQPLALVGVDDGAELGLVVVAMFAVLILAGLYLISAIFSAAFKKIPVIGPPLGNAFDWVTRWARGAMIKTIHGVLWACGKLAHACMALIVNAYEAQLGIVRAIIDAAEHVRFTVIPREITAARQFANRVANQVYYQARAYTNQEISRVRAEVAALRASTDAKLLHLQNTLVTLINATRQVIDARISQIQAQLTARINAAIARADQQFRQAEADLAAGDAAAVAQAVATTVVDIDAEVANAAVKVWAGVEADTQQLVQQLGADFPDIAKLLLVIPTLAPATLPALAGTSLSFLPPLLKLATDCTVPTCRDLGPLRNLLHLLSGLGFDALLLAWLVFCITEPGPAATDTQAVLGALLGPIQQPLKDLLGVP